MVSHAGNAGIRDALQNSIFKFEIKDTDIMIYKYSFTSLIGDVCETRKPLYYRGVTSSVILSY